MHCGAEWTEGKSISVQEKCPFCGKTLMVTFSDSEELSMARVLRQMVEIYGVDIISNQNKCISIFKDIAPELRNEQKILSVALTSGVGEYFTTCSVDERESNIKKAIHSMDYLSNDAKSLVVSSLVDALGWDPEIAKRNLQLQFEDEKERYHFSENEFTTELAGTMSKESISQTAKASSIMWKKAFCISSC